MGVLQGFLFVVNVFCGGVFGGLIRQDLFLYPF